jgi:hypothetical protein
MMLEVKLEVEGLDDIQKMLAKLPFELNVEMIRTMRQAVALVRGEIAEYPAATAANAPGSGYSWYERGFGTRTRTGLAYPTSEALGRSWTTQVRSGMADWRGIVGTNVSYAGFVQGEQQAGFHAVTGWKKAGDVLAGKASAIKRLFQAALGRLVRKMSK